MCKSNLNFSTSIKKQPHGLSAITYLRYYAKMKFKTCKIKVKVSNKKRVSQVKINIACFLQNTCKYTLSTPEGVLQLQQTLELNAFMNNTEEKEKRNGEWGKTPLYFKQVQSKCNPFCSPIRFSLQVLHKQKLTQIPVERQFLLMKRRNSDLTVNLSGKTRQLCIYCTGEGFQ